MPRITERVCAILRFADSSKVTDKKRCVSDLLDLYQDDEAVMEICQNTERGTSKIVNWSYIMNIVHKLAVDEAEKSGKETSAKEQQRQAISRLIINTVRRSNERSSKLLKSSEIVSMALQIFDSKFYVHYQDTYLGILVTYILPKSTNHDDITAEQWRELLLICAKLYKREHLKKHIVLDALQMIVEYSLPRVNLLAEVKDLLLFLENIFEGVNANNEQLIESLYRLGGSVCRQIATESRIALCKFSETVLMDVLRLNDSEEKYRLLLVFLQIHHPNGNSSCDDTAYAYDWNKWKDLMRNMCLHIQENCKLHVQWWSFVQFASEVVKQMIDNANHDDSYSQPIKRKRTINKMENILDLIMDSSSEEVWPVIKILTEMLRKYPQSLRQQDLVPLLQHLTELAQSLSRMNKSTESIMDNVYRLAAVLMENEMSTGEVQDATIHWSKIWDMLLRSLGANQNEESGHVLIRCFLKHNRIPNMNAFLRLYLTKAINWSSNSIRTLLQLCKHISLPEDATVTVLDSSPSTTPVCDRTRLLEWLLNVPWQKLSVRLPIDDLCIVLVEIILSSRCRQNIRMESTNSQDPRYSQSNEARRVASLQWDIRSMDLPRLCYSFLTFKTDLLASKRSVNVEIKSMIMFDGPIYHVQEALNFLKKRLYDIFQEESSNDEVYVMLMKLAFLARLLSTLRQLSILTEDITDCPLVDILKNYLADSFKKILEKIADLSKCKYMYLVSVTKALNVLYGGTYNADIAKIIVSASTENVLKNIFELLNVDDVQVVDYHRNCEYYEDYAYQERRRRSIVSETSSPCPPRETTVRLQVVEAFTFFCALHIGEERSVLQMKIMRNLLSSMEEDFTNCDSRMFLMILESFTRRDQSEIQREYADIPLKFLLEVCQKDRKTEESLRRLLNLLPFFFEYATKYDYSAKKIIETLSFFYQRIHKRNCGVSVHNDYMKCVCNVVRIDPNFLWCVDKVFEEVTMMLDSVLKYIGHPLFVLRTQAVRCLQELLSFESFCYKWKEQIFVKVEKTVLDLLNMDHQLNTDSQNSLQECQHEDDKETRTATALIALTSVACANGVLQGRALRAMLQLTIEREVKVQKIQKILSAAARQTTYTSLVENNLNYLLTSWIEAKYSLQSFPWQILTGCETADNFYKKYINHIIPLLFRTSDLNDVVLFCISVDVTFVNIFEEVFPSCFVWLIYRDLSSTDNVAGQTMKKLLKNTNEFASTRSFNRLFIDRLNDILVELVQRLHDEEHFNRVFSLGAITFPEDPPHYSVTMTTQCFDYLERHFLENSLTRVLVNQQPAALQKSLLQLASAIHFSHSSEDKLKKLHQYAYFCSILMRDLGEPFFDEMAPFLIRDVCYSLLHLTKNADEILSTACCKFLDLFVRRALQMRASEIRDILRFIVANLIGLAQAANSADIALDLLTFLIVEQCDVLREAIAKLNSFPNLKIFREIKKAHNVIRYEANGTAALLEDELERFLNVMNDKNAECMLEDLVHLTQQLSMRKKELRELHRKLDETYLENGSSILYQIIFKLVKLTESPNPCVSMEAAKCLGELGPTDSTVALRPAGSLVRETDVAIEALTYRSVAMLTNFLVENDVNLRKVSADALYTVLSTTYGRKLFDSKHTNDLPNIFHDPFKIDYIRPFIRSRYVAQKSFNMNIAKFRTVMDPENTIWTVKNDENYVDWLVKTTFAVAECFTDSYLESLLSVCQLSVEFCELILPRIIYLIIQRCENSIDTMCNCFNRFFRYHFAINQEADTVTSPASSPDGGCDRKIVRRMLDIVNHVRTQLPDGATFKLDYIYFARAAHECSAYYTALLFAQLACESFSTEYPDFSSDPKIDFIYERQPQLGRVLQDIMQDTYLNISDPDAICGAGSSYLLDHNSRIQYYARTNSWDKVMLAQDIELSHDNPLAAREMMNALHRSGLQFLQWRFLNGNKNLDEQFSYECAWRLGNWDLIVNDATTNQNDPAQLRLELLENAFHRYHYHALKCFRENDQKGTERAVECARRSVIHCLKIVSLESSKTINEKLSQLRLLREIEQLSSADPQEYLEVLRCWDEHEILSGQFEYVEPILQQRITMFRIKDSLKTDTNMQKAFFGTCLNLAMVSESQGNFPVAARALDTLTKHQNLSEDLQNQLLYQEALLEWMKCDQIIARHLLHSLIKKRNLRPNLRAKALRVYGDWMAETKSENPQAVIQKYYLESIAASESIEEQTSDVVRNLHDTQVALARFADVQYEQISSYMKSPTYESLKEYVHTAVKMDNHQIDKQKNMDIKRAVIISQRQSSNDAAELENIEQERRNYLLQALKYYLRTLQHSEEHNLLIFRLVALWLDNMFDEEVNRLLNELDTVPSFKFVPLVPQLAAHMSNDLKNDFSIRIFDILTRCALEHPYHTLPVVLALKNLHSDADYDAAPSGTVVKEKRRVLGAKELLKRISKNNSVRTIVHEMEILSKALVSLAYWKPKSREQKKCYQIPREHSISQIKNLNNVLLPTLSLPVKPSGNYSDVVGVRMYQDTCELVGGVNVPKKIICVGTDGIQRRQLVKSKDDLRQDAVMQQVFTVMNTLLRTCKETKKRNLQIRTYKVIPLTQRSGVLEWCDNTLPITTILTGTSSKPGMHKKYYPRDMNVEMAKKRIKDSAQSSNEEKLKIFLECCRRIRPAFHHFFEEKYLSPKTWVERTLTYTRSVATTSIAGYILGLGDRHLSNILIDEHTAEVVHIDFGIAFEQGKVLPIPETIPFRLTRDIEIAMGASGIEGTMRRSCEATMTMLREQRQIIITLLQVLLYDPLFTWAITPEKACKVQSDVVKGVPQSERAPVETNKVAKRALLRIEQKLQGIEDGLVSSVSGQVERLLQEARDPANLCRIYFGWQPYL